LTTLLSLKATLIPSFVPFHFLSNERWAQD
jgi:hypothetical protein